MAKKMKPVMVPVKTLPASYFRQLEKLRQDQWKPVSRLSKLRQPPKQRRRKFQIWKIIIVEEFMATPEKAQERLNKKKPRKGVKYFLDEVQPRRPRRIMVK